MTLNQVSSIISCFWTFSHILYKFLLCFVSLKELNIFTQIIEKSHSHLTFLGIFKITSLRHFCFFWELYHGSTTAHNTARGDYSAGSYLDLWAPKFDFALNILLRLKGQCTYKIQIRISSYIAHYCTFLLVLKSRD